MKVLLFLLSFILLAFLGTIKPFIKIPENWSKPNYDFSKNPLTQDKINLGRALFYDPILSANNTISCASCHSQYNAFAHADHALSHGINDKIGTRNAPALMNLAWYKSFMWDGAVNHLDMQALAPISHPDEMGENFENVIDKLQKSKIYSTLFLKAFGDSTITGERFLKSMSSFMLTLISANSKYDSVMQGESRFNHQQQNGYGLFKKNCASCHTEPLFTNTQFENNGLLPDEFLKDYGRGMVTKMSSDTFKFKVPTLRNIEFSYPYMHDGRFKNLKEVLNHYTSGIHTNKNVAIQLQKPILLSSNEKVDIITFLLTLTDKTFLFNPKFTYPKEILKP